VVHHKLAIIRRRLFTALSLLSLLLCLATLALWLRSYYRVDVIEHVETSKEPLRWWSIQNHSGHLQLSFISASSADAAAWRTFVPGYAYTFQAPSSGARPSQAVDAWAKEGAASTGRFLNFAFVIAKSPVDIRWFFIPHWFLAVLFAVLPALYLRSAIRSRKHRPGHCPRCGYDLRATPQRCPECGAVPAAA
jgi:hypothetical protein